MSVYLQLLRAAQLATTREEAQKILATAKSMNLLETSYQQQAFDIATK